MSRRRSIRFLLVLFLMAVGTLLVSVDSTPSAAAVFDQCPNGENSYCTTQCYICGPYGYTCCYTRCWCGGQEV
jgi:hypothetical protein